MPVGGAVVLTAEGVHGARVGENPGAAARGVEAGRHLADDSKRRVVHGGNLWLWGRGREEHAEADTDMDMCPVFVHDLGAVDLPAVDPLTVMDGVGSGGADQLGELRFDRAER